MDECRNHQIEKMLYAYELGMLADDDREVVELHILECESCREKVIGLQDASEAIRHSEDLRDHVKQLDESSKKTTSTKSIWSVIIPVAAVILTVLVLLNWPTFFMLDTKVVASENRLVILPFVNDVDPADPQNLGEMAANLLIADFTESHYIQIVSRERIFDIQKMLDIPDTTRELLSHSVRIARTADARWLMTGRILQTEPELILGAQIIEVATGDMYVAKQSTGVEGASIFTVVDDLSSQVKSDLLMSEEALTEFDPAVSDVTTHSSDAYQWYVAGMEDYLKFYYDDAAKDFEKALTFDSTFAMAYYYLSIVKDESIIEQAMKYKEQCSFREQIYIQATFESINHNGETVIELLRQLLERYPDEKIAHYRLGYYFYVFDQYDSSEYHLKTAIDLDPSFKAPLSMLAYLYQIVDRVDEALAVLDTYAKLAPEEARPYHSKGDLLARQGKLSEAIASYKTALERKADYTASTYSIAMMYLFAAEFDSSETYCRRLMSSAHPADRASGRYILATGDIFKGHLSDALSILDDAIAADRLEFKKGENSQAISTNYQTKAWIYSELNKPDSALDAFQKNIDYESVPARSPILQSETQRVILLTELELWDDAEQALAGLKERFADKPDSIYSFAFPTGYYDLARGNPGSALAAFEVNPELVQSYVEFITKARAFTTAGRYDEAVEVLEEINTTFTRWRAYWWPWTIRLPYYLGQAYEGQGRYVEAIAQYRAFVDIWGNADFDCEDIADAQDRIEKLTSMP